MEEMNYAVRQTVETCLGFKPGEKAAIIYDRAASEIAEPIFRKADQISLGNVQMFLMESYGSRPDNGSLPLEFPDEIRHALRGADVSMFIAKLTKKGEFKSFRSPLTKSIGLNPRLRHAHMPGITREIFKKGMSVDYYRIKKIIEKVYSIARHAETVKVTTPAGSDFVATFAPKYKWVVCDGFPIPGKWTNLPDGETFTTPVSVDGKIVVDGVLGDYFDRKYGLLNKTPLMLDFEDGRITGVSCFENKALESEFKAYISKDENANRVGEFAIGTNIGLEGLLGNMLYDEKFPGVHIAVGDPLGEDTKAEWKSDVHCDMVLRNCSIFVDGRQIMSNGKFVPEILGE